MHPEESQWVLATWFSSQGVHKALEKASGAWELFTEGKPSVDTPNPFSLKERSLATDEPLQWPS